MRLSAVNIGRPEPIESKDGASAINKKSQSGAVRIAALGPVGDTVVDTDNHGGPDQAVYVLGQADYDYWAQDLGRALSAGILGENLLIDGLSSEGICVGDRLAVGEVVLEVTSPRIPCVVLARWMGDMTLPKRFIRAQHPGFYCRVIREGEVAAGQAVTLTPFEGARVSVVEIMHWVADGSDKAAARHFLDAPVHHKLRDDLAG
ncbi:MOSC domain-containing protein [Celeribacter sp.]|uniref:MOSC domain-containing protein n=1 Tax=Celeribacter sp. TaxID=1890673 RepID=UPI003A8E6D29